MCGSGEGSCHPTKLDQPSLRRGLPFLSRLAYSAGDSGDIPLRAPIRPALVLAVLALTGAGLSGCGRKGALETPTASATPAATPAATAAATPAPDAPPAVKTVKTPGATIVPSKEPSILDAIL